MARGKTMSERIRSADGRIKIATLSGVSLLVAVIALLIGVLPVFADHGTTGITPDPLNEGGGEGKCFVETGDLPSLASNEYHNNNPSLGTFTSDDDVIEIFVEDTERGRVFDFRVTDDYIGQFVVYDVIVNGGPKSLHYDFESNGGPVPGADDLHAPSRGNGSLYNLSHINICYDIPGLTSVPCEGQPIRVEGQSLLLFADLQVFDNSVVECIDRKTAQFSSAGDIVTLSFEGDGEEDVAGRLDFYKQFPDPTSAEAMLADLEYRPTELDMFADVAWCTIRDKDTDATPPDGNQFDDVLATTEYPSLADVSDAFGDATACKVSERVNASAVQHTVVYFEFVDPNFR